MFLFIVLFLVKDSDWQKKNIIHECSVFWICENLLPSLETTQVERLKRTAAKGGWAGSGWDKSRWKQGKVPVAADYKHSKNK